LDHERSGDLIVVASAGSWFTYYYWLDDGRAPDFARTVDIHRKPGYDPVELFLDPEQTWIQLKVAGKLLRKRLGFRVLMDVVPLNATLVHGSHGRVPDGAIDFPVLILEKPPERGTGQLDSTQVYSVIRDAVCGFISRA
jgi:hypothetical protein